MTHTESPAAPACPVALSAADVVRRYGLTAADLVVEVGCGAGGWLRAVQALGPRVLGFEPHLRTLLKTYRGGVPGVSAVFDRASAGYLRATYGPAAVLVLRESTRAAAALAAECVAPGGVVLHDRGGRLEEWPTARAAA